MSMYQSRMMQAALVAACLVLAVAASLPLAGRASAANDAPQRRWLPATAYAVPKETAPEGEGYFSIIEGHNGRLYIGTHANALNCWLVEFDPATEKMEIVVDAMKEIGSDAKGFAAQSKIHTRNNVGASGKIYFGTKQGYPEKGEKHEDYPGGYPMVYDPQTGKTKVYPIPVPHSGIISITPDESRGVAYISTCSDTGPIASGHFLILDLETGKYRDLMDAQVNYAFIVVDYLGRAYHPILGGDIARYDPQSDKLERLKQTIDGQPPTAESLLAHPESQIINWDISPDRKTLYAVPYTSNGLYAYDLTATGDTLPGRFLGPLLPGSKATSCYAMCVGPTGEVWVALTEPAEGINLHHLVSYRPGDKAPIDLGPVGIHNPDYTQFTDAAGQPLPAHAGFVKMPDGTVTTRFVILGVCEAHDGAVYVLALSPYTVLKIEPPQRKWLPATAYAVPKETAPEGEGYFSIIEGHNGRLYIGTHANALNCWLVEFDPATEKMEIVVDAMKEIGSDAKGFAAQSKIHTRNNVGASGKIYFGTKQGYPAQGEERTDYPGGYPMVYDPQTGKTKVYPIPVPHSGIISVTPDESRGVAYISTCSDTEPIDNGHFLILDLDTGKYRDLMATQLNYAFIVVDYLGRAYHPILGGDIARYDPRADNLERLTQTIDGQPPTAESELADTTGFLNWDISPDRKTLYAVPMSDNHLYAYDLTATGDTLAGRCLGTLVLGAKGFDCRAMCVGPTGEVWVAVTEEAEGIRLHHLVSYRPGDKAPIDLGPVAIRNPDYTQFTDAAGQPLPGHHGIREMPDGAVTTRFVIHGVCEARDGEVYVLALCPYTVLKIEPPQDRR